MKIFASQNSGTVASKRGSKSQRGAVMLEATLALPALLFLTLIVIDLLLISYRALSMQFVAEKVLRQAILPSASAAAVVNAAVSVSAGLGVTITPANIALCPVNLIATNCNFNTANLGGVNDSDMIELKIRLPIDGFVVGKTIFSLLAATYTVDAAVVALKEPG